MVDYKGITTNVIYAGVALIGFIAFLAWLPPKIRIMALLAIPLLLFGCFELSTRASVQEVRRQSAEKDLQEARRLLGDYRVEHGMMPRSLEEITDDRDLAGRMVKALEYVPGAGQGEALLESKDMFPGPFGFGRYRLAVTTEGLETGKIVRVPAVERHR